MQSSHIPDNDLELLTPAEMAEADRLAAIAGPYDGYGLMCNAGLAIMEAIIPRYATAAGFDILCGPGNNGGDGYVVARLLIEAGFSVRVWAQSNPKPGSSGERAAQLYPFAPRPLGQFKPLPDRVIIDALYGSGLTRALEGIVASVVKASNEVSAKIVAIDLPSGISGETGKSLGVSFEAEMTITFFRLKPGHLLEPGRSRCGEILLADIGINKNVLEAIAPHTFINLPSLWNSALPRPQRNEHKYSRGHVVVFSGGPSSSGAARLSAMAAARAGAGAVTLYTPGNALPVNAAHLTSIMLHKVDTVQDFLAATSLRRHDALVLGPGFGLDRPLRDMIQNVLTQKDESTLVLDADGITIFRDAPEALFRAVTASSLNVVLTPHEGEFVRLFPDLADDPAGSDSKLARARKAAQRAGAIIVLKGADTVIAAPDGRAAINSNGTSWLATAGSGDVLAGLIAGLSAQKMPVWEATCAAVWLHAQAATEFGPGLISEDLPGLVPAILKKLYASTRDCSAIAPNGARDLPAVMK